MGRNFFQKPIFGIFLGGRGREMPKEKEDRKSKFERESARAFRRDCYEPKLKNVMKSYRDQWEIAPIAFHAGCLQIENTIKEYEPAFWAWEWF